LQQAALPPKDNGMLFSLTVRLNFDFERRHTVSQSSQKLAAYVRQFRANRPIEDAATVIRNRILDEGFARLRDDLKSELEKQVEELNQEAGCGDALVCRFTDKESGVFRTDDSESFVSVKFDSAKRTVAIACDKPLKFKHFVEVRLVNDGTAWWFVAGENKKNLAGCGDSFAWLAQKALYALYDVEA
jgi:hypothetical protein